jgi:acyl-CoA thioesterase FadM
MPRVILREKELYPFSTTLSVRVSDLNYGGHLGYDRLLGLAHEARLELFAMARITELDLGDARTGIIASDAAVTYQGEAFRGDSLVFEIAAVEVSPSSFRLAHRVRHTDGSKIALIEIGFIAFDYGRRGISSLPETFASFLRTLS